MIEEEKIVIKKTINCNKRFLDMVADIQKREAWGDFKSVIYACVAFKHIKLFPIKNRKAKRYE